MSKAGERLIAAAKEARQIAADANLIRAACIAYNQVLLNQPEDERDQTAAMRAALAVVRGEGWQPIAEAPRTGSTWHPEFGPVVLLGSVFGQRALAYWNGECWANLHDHAPLSYWNEMTHWQPVAEAPTDQPLPPPPEAE